MNDDIVFHLQEACDLEETVALRCVVHRVVGGTVTPPVLIGFRVLRYARASGHRVTGWIFNCSGKTKDGRKASFEIHAVDGGTWDVKRLRIAQKPL